MNHSIPQRQLQVGGTLNPRKHVFVSRQDLEDELLEMLKRGEYCNLLSSRQVGKSSIMLQTAIRLQQLGIRVATIDVGGELGTPTMAAEWYLGFLTKVARSLRIELDVKAWWEQQQGTRNQRLLDFFRSQLFASDASPVVLFVDEIDSTLKLPFTDDFFTAIRAMYNQRGNEPAYEKIAFCLIGVATPNELVKDRRTTSYNVGRTFEVRDFDLQRDDLSAVAALLADDPSVAFDLLRQVLHWTGGHPYLTLLLCRDIRENQITSTGDVDELTLKMFASYSRIQSDVHFQQITRFLSERVTDQQAAYQMYDRILQGQRERDTAGQTHIELKLAGIVKRNLDGNLVVRNPIYRQIFDGQWVRQSKPQRQHNYDFFISYTKADEPWAEWIVWQLEEVATPPYRVICQAWDFHAGDDWVRLMQEGTTKASRTIAVLSPEFLQAKFTEAEWQATFAKDPTGELGLLVPVRVAECKPEGLLKAQIYIDLVGLEEERARTKLLESISSKRRKPAIAPQFPTTSVLKSEPSFPGPDVTVCGDAPSRKIEKVVLPSTSSAANLNWREHGKTTARIKTVIKIFASSPGDVDGERNVLEEVVASINRTDGERDGFVTELFRWETDVVPQIGPPPQTVVDQQTPCYEIYLGIMSARYGGGGTIKEFQDALAQWNKSTSPWIMFYFNDKPQMSHDPRDVEQYLQVCKLRRELQSHRIVGSYEGVRGNTKGFYEQISEHLRKIVAQLIPRTRVDGLRHDTTKYLQSLREATAFIDIRGLGVGAGRANRFPIEELYITLTSIAPGQREAGKMGERRGLDDDLLSTRHQQPLEAVLSDHDRLVVVSDPGAGKTTFLRRLAFALCQRQLGEVPYARALSEQLADRPFPILVRFHELAQHLKNASGESSPPQGADAAMWLPHFLGAQSIERTGGLDTAFFQQQLEQGQCTVLLDGLDEAPDRLMRERVSRLVQNVTAAFGGCRFVVTSRPAAYTGQAVLSGFAEARIDPLSSQSVEAFLRRWCGAIHADEEAIKEHLEELLSLLRARSEIRRMARNPVMLTALAVVHWHEKRLPEQRAELYESIIQWLSRAREQRPGRETADRTVVLLENLALAMQTDVEGRKVQVPQRWAAETLAAEFGEGQKSPASIAKAEKFLGEEEIDSGIIVGRGHDVAFWHLTFQEFKAARAIAAQLEEEQAALLFRDPERLFLPEWREMLALLAGALHTQGKAKVDGLITRLLDWLYGTGDPPTLANQARCAGLIGVLLRDLEPVKYQVSDARYPPLLDSVMAIFDPARTEEVDLQQRIAAADTLGQAGDPRLDRRKPDYWVSIAAGKFWMGAQKQNRRNRNYDSDAFDNESPVHEVTLSEFRISRYPVAVGEYREFIDDEGYLEPRWWSAGGFGQHSLPGEWDSQVAYPSRPVVGVSWYETSAYAAWAGCRLPTEAEWERAARGLNGRKFPWGSHPPESGQVNNEDANVGHPAPVGIFPRDATPDGVCDLAGNVWEWCADEYDDYSAGQSSNPRGPTERSFRVYRGGGWNGPAAVARSAYRYGVRPSFRHPLLGFRLALSPLGQ